MSSACSRGFLRVCTARKILGVFEVLRGVFEKTKEKKGRAFTWSTFRPQIKIFSPPLPPKPKTPLRRRHPPGPSRPGEPPPLLGFSIKKRSPPSQRLGLPLSPPEQKRSKKYPKRPPSLGGADWALGVWTADVDKAMASCKTWPAILTHWGTGADFLPAGGLSQMALSTLIWGQGHVGDRQAK